MKKLAVTLLVVLTFATILVAAWNDITPWFRGERFDVTGVVHDEGGNPLRATVVISETDIWNLGFNASTAQRVTLGKLDGTFRVKSRGHDRLGLDIYVDGYQSQAFTYATGGTYKLNVALAPRISTTTPADTGPQP